MKAKCDHNKSSASLFEPVVLQMRIGSTRIWIVSSSDDCSRPFSGSRGLIHFRDPSVEMADQIVLHAEEDPGECSQYNDAVVQPSDETPILLAPSLDREAHE